MRRTPLAAVAGGWTFIVAMVASGACYKLTDLGMGCSLSPVVAPECVLSTKTNKQVNGTTTQGTGQGKTDYACASEDVCVRTVGKLDGSGNCVASPPPNGWTDTVTTSTCSLTGSTCTMAGN